MLTLIKIAVCQCLVVLKVWCKWGLKSRVLCTLDIKHSVAPRALSRTLLFANGI
jgi:hypothetical protein